MATYDDLDNSYREQYRAEFSGSPHIRLLGMDLQEFGHGRSRIELQVGERHINLQGTVQGGVFATLIDSGMSAAVRCFMTPGQILATVEMKINFMATIRAGDRLISEGEVLQYGRRVIVARATIRNAVGRVVAAGQGTFMVASGGRESLEGCRLPG